MHLEHKAKDLSRVDDSLYYSTSLNNLYLQTYFEAITAMM